MPNSVQTVQKRVISRPESENSYWFITGFEIHRSPPVSFAGTTFTVLSIPGCVPGFKVGNGNVNPKIGWPDPRLLPPDYQLYDRTGQEWSPLCASYSSTIGCGTDTPLRNMTVTIGEYRGIVPSSIQSFILLITGEQRFKRELSHQLSHL